MMRAFLLAAFGALAPVVVAADTITSTPFGGFWHSSTTWLGSVVPGAGDAVVIQGPVHVVGAASCLSLEVLSGGTISNGAFSMARLAVAASVANQGTIEDGLQFFTIEIGGDLVNDAMWANRETVFTGVADRHLSCGAHATVESSLSFDDEALGDLIVETPFALLGQVDTGNGRMILRPGCPLTLREGIFEGELLCNGNEVRFESWSYLADATLDAAVLVGEADVTAGVTFTGGLTVMGVLQNFRSGGSAHIVIEGGLVNHGTIQNNQYGLTVDLSGDLVCDGVIRCSLVALDGPSEHRLSMGPEGDIGTIILLPEFEPETIVVDTDVRISGGVALGVGGTMVLSPGASLIFTEHGSLSGGTLLAAGNDVHMDDLGALRSIVVDDAVMHGTVRVGANCSFTGDLVVRDTLQSFPFANPVMVVEGPMLNEGLIHDGETPLAIRALGHVANEGQWRNASLVIAGTDDQTIDMGEGLDVPEIVLESGLSATVYQWYRDGDPIEDETSPTLMFATLGAADAGAYHCEGDGQLLSRTVLITAGPAVGVVLAGSGVPAALILERARPNPFVRTTEIGFSLGEAAQVRLAVFDVTGRQVSVLVDGRVSAGRHSVSWQPRNAPPSVYFLRLRAGTMSVVRTVTLLE